MATALLDALNALAQDIDIRVLPTASPYIFDLSLLTPSSSSETPSFHRPPREKPQAGKSKRWTSSAFIKEKKK